MALATAKLFVAEGAYVFLTGRQQDKLDEAVRAIGRNVTGVPGDSANLDDLDRLYETVKREKGKIDGLFASAGAFGFGKIGEITEESFDNVFKYECARHALYGAKGPTPLRRRRLHFPEWVGNLY